jgi:hypothetical protein
VCSSKRDRLQLLPSFIINKSKWSMIRVASFAALLSYLSNAVIGGLALKNRMGDDGR